MSQTPEPTPEPPHPSGTRRVQEEFIRAIEAQGIVQVLTYIGDWYARIAQAAVEEDLVRQLGEHAGDREAAALTAQEALLSFSRRLEYRSSAVGDELMKDAMVAAWSKTMTELTRADLRDRWDSIRTRLKGPDSTT